MHALILLAILLLVSTEAWSYTLNKCCPEHQQLSSKKFRTCVDYDQHTPLRADVNQTHANGTRSPGPGSESDLPWWIPRHVEILDSDSFAPVSPASAFLKGPFPLQVQYGVQLPCSYQTTQIIVADPEIQYLAFLDNGSIMFNDYVFSDVNKTFPGITYCVDRVDLAEEAGDRHVIKLCPCLTQTCLKKCCTGENVLEISEAESRCVPGGNETLDWRPEVMNGSHSLDEFSVLVGVPSCPPAQSPLLLNPTSVDRGYKYWVKNNGDIHIEKFGVRSESPYKEYCADITKFEDGTISRNLVHCEAKLVIEESSNALYYGVLVLVGAFFLLATLVVYAVLPELRNVHGKNLMAHTASFLVAYLSLGAVQLVPRIPHDVCVGIGFTIQFSFLAAFFWLNVMCVDISWTFSGLRAPQGSARVRDRKKFLYFSVYAWGSAGLISLATALMEFTPGISSLKPGFGIESCLFNGPRAALVFFYVPMSLLLLANLILFVYTAARIIAVRRQTAVLFKPGSAAYNKDKQKIILYMKLFLLMGVTWVTEIISWAVGGPAYFWYLTDVLNLLRAVFIFIIFCCKRSVLELFKRRFLKPGKAQEPSLRSKEQRNKEEASENSASLPGDFPASVVLAASDETSVDLRKMSTTTLETTVLGADC